MPSFSSRPLIRGASLYKTVAAILLVGNFTRTFVYAQSETPRVTLPSFDETASSSVSNTATSTVAAPEASARNGSSSTSSPPTTSVSTTVVSIFYLNIRGDADEERGAPYTLYHRDTGEVIGVDQSATTYVVTGTITDFRTATNGPNNGPSSTASRGSGRGAVGSMSFRGNRTAKPSTITQGVSTFMFTGTNFGPDRTLVNQCKLEGTTSATCSLTHIGTGWYTRKSPEFKGAWSTYSYSWTDGDRFGFAPVTITSGLEKLPGPSAAAGDDEGAAGGARGVLLSKAYVMALIAALIAGLLALV